MSKTLGNILKYTLSFGVAALLVWLVVRQIDWRSFAEGLRNTRWIWMLGYVASAVLALVFRAQRWKQLLKPLDGRITYGRCWDANNIGNLGSLVIPGSCEPIRAGIITSRNVPFQTVFGTMIMERAWDFFFIFFTFIAALVLKWDVFGSFVKKYIVQPISEKSAVLWIIVLVVLLVVAFLWACYRYRDKVKFFGKVAGIMDGLIQGMGSFSKISNKLPYIIYTTMIWVMYMFMSYFCLKAIPELSGLDMADALFMSALGNVASIIPVPGGVGAYHYLLMLSISTLYGFSEETGLLFAVLNHEGHAILILVLGIWSYVMRILIMKNKDLAEIRSERSNTKN